MLPIRSKSNFEIKKTSYLIQIITLIFLFFGVIVYYASSITPFYIYLTNQVGISISKILFTDNSKSDLQYYKGNKIDFVFIGVSDEASYGVNEADIIIFASYDTESNIIKTYIIPQSLWSNTYNIPFYLLYKKGEEKQRGLGQTYLKTEISSFIGRSMQYAIVSTFSGMTKCIDGMAGLDITIQKSFTDEKFPIQGKENDNCMEDSDFRCRYSKITFTEGKRRMDGTTTLSFMRSINGDNGEDNEPSRRARTQIVLSSFVEKLQKIATERDLKKIKNIYSSCASSFIHDLKTDELYELFQKITNKPIKTYPIVLPKDTFELFQGDSKGFLNVFSVKNNDTTHFHGIINCLFDTSLDKQCVE